MTVVTIGASGRTLGRLVCLSVRQRFCCGAVWVEGYGDGVVEVGDSVHGMIDIKASGAEVMEVKGTCVGVEKVEKADSPAPTSGQRSN